MKLSKFSIVSMQRLLSWNTKLLLYPEIYFSAEQMECCLLGEYKPFQPSYSIEKLKGYLFNCRSLQVN